MAGAGAVTPQPARRGRPPAARRDRWAPTSWWWLCPLAFLLVGWLTRNRPLVNSLLIAGFLTVLGLACIVVAARAVRRSWRSPSPQRQTSLALLVAFVLLHAASVAVGGAMWTGPGGYQVSDTTVARTSILHLLSSIAMMIAVLSFPGPRRSWREWPALLLDLGIAVGAGSLACWYFIAGPALYAGDASSSQVWLAVIIPVQDLIIAYGALLALLRGVTSGRAALTHLIVGTVCLTVADLYVAYRVVHWHGGTMLVPVAVQAVVVAGMTQLAVAAALHLRTCRGGRVVENTEPVPGVTYVPYLAVLGGFVLLVVAVIQHGSYPWTGLALGTMLMTGAMGVRQLLAIRDNQRLATVDGMTGLANRRSLIHGLERALDRARRLGETAAVLLFDLNGFKEINDVHGHEAGDAVLRAFAASLRRNVLGSDVVGRLGGDEFAVVLHAIRTRQDAVTVAERIFADLVGPIPFRDRHLTIRTSVGIALTRPDDDTTQVLHRADQAMYLAKRESPTASSWRVHVDGDVRTATRPA